MQYRGNSENKLFYLVDQLVGGINTEFSDDNSADIEFESLINMDIDRVGTLDKRKGFGELTAISELFNLLGEDNLPQIKTRTEAEPNPEATNDNVVYAKLLKNDNNCFRNLSAFGGEKGYRKYQEMYGFQDNEFKLLIITVNGDISTAWLYKGHLPELQYDLAGDIEDPEDLITCTKTIIPAKMRYEDNLFNIETIDFHDYIYFTSNDKGLIIYDRLTDKFSYGFDTGVEGEENALYKPAPLDITEIGFNVLADDPLNYISPLDQATDSIQTVLIYTENKLPILYIPNTGKFSLGILYTGAEVDFAIEIKNGEEALTFEKSENTELSKENLKVYDINLTVPAVSELEIMITKTGSSISPAYFYKKIDTIDPNQLAIEGLKIGEYGMCFTTDERVIYYKDNMMWFSESTNAEYVPASNYEILPLDPTDKITKITYFKGYYIVFTKERIYRLVGTYGSSEFRIEPVNLSIGCHAGNTVVPVEDTLFFASPRGLYALKSSSFSQDITNLKELDIRVKTLTSDFTLYKADLSDPSIRFNGISEKAYGLRYKDKYILFFNSFYEKGDYAAQNNLDALVYQLDLGSYTTYRFKEKPTFMFMVDSALETFCTIEDKKQVLEGQDLFSYDFTQGEGTSVEDLTGNGYDANIEGDIALSKGAGVDLNGESSYIDIGDIPATMDMGNNFFVDLDLDIKSLRPGDTLFSFGQSEATQNAEVSKINIASEVVSINDKPHYQFIIDGQGVMNKENNCIDVTYSLLVKRMSKDVGNNVKGTLSLTTDTDTLIEPTSFDVTFDDEALVLTMFENWTFTIPYDTSVDYFKSWVMSVSGTCDTTRIGYELGDSISKSTGDKSTELSWLKIGFNYAAVAKAGVDGGNGTTTVTISNVYIKKTSTAGYYKDSARNLYVTVGGTNLAFSIPKWSSKGTYKSTTSSKSTSFSYIGSKQITIDARYNVDSDFGGVEYTNLNIDAFKVNLPDINYYNEIITTEYTANGIGDVDIKKLDPPGYNDITLKVGENNSLVLTSQTVEGETFVLDTDEDAITTGSHTINAGIVTIYDEFDEETGEPIGEGYKRIQIAVDDVVLVESDFGGPILSNVVRDSNFIGTDRLKEQFADIVVKSVLTTFGVYFSFTEGSGTVVGNGSEIKGTLIDCEWLTQEGLLFGEVPGYISLPTFPDTVNFSNGIGITFSAILHRSENAWAFDRLSKIVSLASSKNENSLILVEVSTKKGTKSGNIILTLRGDNGREAQVKTRLIDLSVVHEYSINCTDNGSGYLINILVDGEEYASEEFRYGVLNDIVKDLNYIGYQGEVEEGQEATHQDLDATFYTFNFKIYPRTLIKWKSALYEFGTTDNDFGRPIYFEIKSKGVNFQYPLHIKKLKHIFVKAIGGYNFNEFFFELYSDNYLVNDPKVYNCYIDEEGKVVYDYTEVKELKIDERVSLLGNMRLGKARLGEGKYQTKKLVLGAKGKNFTIKMYGESTDEFSVESFGYTFKLGKVKGD